MKEKIRLDRFGLRAKLILAFMIVAILAAVTGGVGFYGVATVDEEAHIIAEDGIKMAHAAEMIVAIEQQQSAVQAAQLGEPNAQDTFETANEHFVEESSGLQASHLSPEQKEQFDTVQSQHDVYTTLATNFFDARAAGNDELAAQKAAEMNTIRVEMESNAHAIEESAQADLDTQVVAADTTTQRTQIEIVVLTVVAFVAAVLIGLFVADRIGSPVNQLSEATVSLSEGDFDVEVDDHVEDDEIGRMVESFQQMHENLVGVFTELEVVSRNLQTGTVEQDVGTDYPGQYGEITAALDDGTEQLSESFDQISTASAGLEAGDFDRRFETDYPGDYGEVLCDLENGIDEVSTSVSTVQDIATEVASSSQEVTASVEEIQMASEEVAGSVEEISQGTEEQSETLHHVSEEMTDLSATVEEIAASSQEVVTTASGAVEQSNQGKAHASTAIDEIRSIETKATAAADQVETLDEEMDAIGEIVDVITDIAEQTNLLAVNASIEAARVGEDGQGFAVVADEIKELAADAARETTAIEERISTVQMTTTETVAGIDEMTSRVESGSETIEDAVAMFDDIAEAIQDAENGINEISDATGDQASSSEEVVSMVGEVAGVSEQTAAEASNVSAATEEQTASLSEASESVQHLARLADGLFEQVSTFDVRAVTSEFDQATAPSSPTGSPSIAMGDGGRTMDD